MTECPFREYSTACPVKWRTRTQLTHYDLQGRHMTELRRQYLPPPCNPPLSLRHHRSKLFSVHEVKDKLEGGPNVLVCRSPVPLPYVVIEDKSLGNKVDPL